MKFCHNCCWYNRFYVGWVLLGFFSIEWLLIFMTFYTLHVCICVFFFAALCVELVTSNILGLFYFIYLLWFIFWCIRSTCISKYQQYSNISENNMAKNIIRVVQDHSTLCCSNWSTAKPSWTFPGIFNYHMRFLKWKFCLL